MSVPPRAPAASAPPLAVDDEEDDPPPPPELSDELPHATANSAVATTTVAGKTERFTSTPPRLDLRRLAPASAPWPVSLGGRYPAGEAAVQWSGRSDDVRPS